jgi:hypothetical protein
MTTGLTVVAIVGLAIGLDAWLRRICRELKRIADVLEQKSRERKSD